nr:PAS domain S-box protein [Sphingomonas aerophila]
MIQGLDQRARALARTARRWELSGGRTRTDFELEAAVNLESFPAFRSLGWVDAGSVVRWVYPVAGNSSTVGLNNNKETRRRTALQNARRTGRLAIAGPLGLKQGGQGFLFFQPITPIDAKPQGFIYAAVDSRQLMDRIFGDLFPHDSLRVSVAGEPLYTRIARGKGVEDSDATPARAEFRFGGLPWRIEAATSAGRLGLAQVVPAIAALISLGLAAVTMMSLRGQARALSLRRTIRVGEERFRTMTDAVPGLLFVTDAEGANTHTNVVFQNYTGRSGEDLLGNGWLEALHPDDRARAAEVWARATADLGSYEAEYRFRRYDGAYRWFLVRGLPHRDDAGQVDRWFGACTDIHDLREAQAALLDGEARLRAIVDTAVDAIVVIDERGTMASANPATERVFGYSADELIGANVALLMDADEAAGHDHHLSNYALSGVGKIIGIGRDVQGQRKDGTSFPLELTIAGWSDAAGHQFFTEIMRDVTSRQAAEAALRESEALLAAVLEALPVGMIIADASGKIIRDNRANRELWGVAPETSSWEQYGEWVGYQPDTGERIQANDWAMSRALLHGETVTNELIQNERFDTGERRYYLNNAAPVRNASGTIIAGVVAELDITERLEAEAEVRRLNRDLEQRVEERTRRLAEVNHELQAFAYSVSHDLRAPLRAMQGFGQALTEDYGDQLDELGRNYLGRIVAGAKQMDVLILDLLAFSRLSREEVVLGPVSLDSAIDAALSQANGLLRERNADVEVVRPAPIVSAHAPVLIQVLANLISNAVKFVAAGTTPKVRLRPENRGQRVRLWVEDNGIGIADEHQKRIFEVFQRLHSAAEYPGTGIGLAIVRKGVERLGGTAGVESTLGEGSSFWIELPQAEGHAEHQTDFVG